MWRFPDSLLREDGNTPTPRCGSRRLSVSPIQFKKKFQWPTPRLSIWGVGDSPTHRLWISPRIRSWIRKGLKGCVRDQWRRDLCKKTKKTCSLPCPCRVFLDAMYIFKEYLFFETFLDDLDFHLVFLTVQHNPFVSCRNQNLFFIWKWF